MNAVDSERKLGDGKFESEDTASDVETPEAEAAAPITSGRLSISSAESGECGVSFDPEGVILSNESLVTAIVPGSSFDVPYKRSTALHTGEARRLAEYHDHPVLPVEVARMGTNRG